MMWYNGRETRIKPSRVCYKLWHSLGEVEHCLHLLEDKRLKRMDRQRIKKMLKKAQANLEVVVRWNDGDKSWVEAWKKSEQLKQEGSK